MLGLGDITVSLAYILTVAAALLCVIYGLINWDKGQATEIEYFEEEEWAREEKKIEESL